VLRSVQSECWNQGLKFGPWETKPYPGSTAQRLEESEIATPDFIILEAERKADWPMIIHQLWADGDDDIPTATVTNLDEHGIPGYFDPIIEAGWHCLTECYIQDNPNATPERMEFQAGQVGFDKKKVQPVLGLHGGLTLLDYAEWLHYPGWSVWSAEYVL